MSQGRPGPAGMHHDIDPPRQPVTPRAAATVVLMRQGSSGPEVLLTHRPATMAFAAGLFVFPGGAVDRGDLDPAIRLRLDIDEVEAFERLGGSTAPEEALASHVAAIRELFEEAGVLLSAHPIPDAARLAAQADLAAGGTTFGDVCRVLDLDLTARALIPLSRWVTPAALPRRFDARFFAAAMPPGATTSFVGAEVAAHAWLTPRAALDGLADGSVPMWMPTSANLQRLLHAGDVEAVRSRLASGPGGVPDRAVIAPDIVRVRLPSGAGVDALEVNAYLVGGRSLAVIDPGDPSEEGLLEIIEAAEASGGSIGAAALTAPDPDHAGGSEHVREGLGAPIVGSARAGAELPFPVVPLPDGARVPGVDVRVELLAAPGPRPEHAVYHIPSSRSVLVGDLLGRPPAFEIPGPVDLGAWRRSVDRVRRLEARRLLPAHGDAVEGEAAVRAALDAVEDAVRAGHMP
jgi:ribonuclease/clavin/mitogillin